MLSCVFSRDPNLSGLLVMSSSPFLFSAPSRSSDPLWVSEGGPLSYLLAICWPPISSISFGKKSLQLPSNNRYDQMCVLINTFESLGWSPNCRESGGPWFFTIIVYNGHGHLKNWHWHWKWTWQRYELKTLTLELLSIALKIWPRIAGLLHTSPIVSFYYVTKCFILWCPQKYLFLLCHRMFVFIMSPNGGGAALYSTVRQLTLLFRAAAARIKSQSQIIIIFLSNHNPK